MLSETVLNSVRLYSDIVASRITETVYIQQEFGAQEQFPDAR